MMPTFIASHTTFHGTLHCKEECVIEGEVEGTLWCDQVVVIAPNGIFKGLIYAPLLIVQGRCEGNVTCDKVKLLPHAHMKGEIHSHLFIMHPKALFDGQRILTQPSFTAHEPIEKPLNELDTENILL